MVTNNYTEILLAYNEYSSVLSEQDIIEIAGNNEALSFSKELDALKGLMEGASIKEDEEEESDSEDEASKLTEAEGVEQTKETKIEDVTAKLFKHIDDYGYEGEDNLIEETFDESEEFEDFKTTLIDDSFNLGKELERIATLDTNIKNIIKEQSGSKKYETFIRFANDNNINSGDIQTLAENIDRSEGTTEVVSSEASETASTEKSDIEQKDSGTDSQTQGTETVTTETAEQIGSAETSQPSSSQGTQTPTSSPTSANTTTTTQHYETLEGASGSYDAAGSTGNYGDIIDGESTAPSYSGTTETSPSNEASTPSSSDSSTTSNNTTQHTDTNFVPPPFSAESSGLNENINEETTSITYSILNAGDSFQATTANGTYGTYSLNQNGEWTYNLDIQAVDYLNEGEKLSDSFAIEASDGTSYTVIITILGSNDQAIISSANIIPISQTLTEDDSTTTSVTGTLIATDVDNDDNKFTVLTSSQAQYGTYSITEDGEWSYDLDSSLSQALNALGDTETITFTTIDASPHNITINLIGSNDGATISGVDTGSITEASELTVFSGQILVTDIDNDDNKFISQTGITTSYGTYNIDENGNWAYNINSSIFQSIGANGETDSFVVSSIDGTTHTITIDLIGDNKPSIITGLDIGDLVEDNNIITSITGTLSSNDIDNDNKFTAISVASQSLYGTYTITENGVWTYNLDATLSQALNDTGATDSLKVTSTDGTEHIITISLSGSNDGATITGTDTANLAEDNMSLTTATGTILSDDVDNDNNKFIAINTEEQATYGTYTITEDGVWTYQLDNNLVQYINDSGATDIWTVTSIDGTNHIITINIVGVNDVATIANFSNKTVTLKNQPINIAEAIVITDIDNDNLTNLTIKVTNYNNVEDFFFLENQVIGLNSGTITMGTGFNYTASENSSGELSIVISSIIGNNTIAEFQSLIRTLSYNNNNLTNPDTATKSIQIIVDEGTSNEAQITANLNITTIASQENISYVSTLFSVTDVGTYQITEVIDNHNNVVTGLFEINSNGEVSLVTGENLDYETAQNYNISIDVTDSNSNVSKQQYFLNVTDVDDGTLGFLNISYVEDDSNIIASYNFENSVTGATNATIDDISHNDTDSSEIDASIGIGANSGIEGGARGNYLQLDASSNNAELSLGEITLGNEFTLSAWFQFADDNISQRQYIASITNEYTQNFTFNQGINIYRSHTDINDIVLIYHQDKDTSAYIVFEDVIDTSPTTNPFQHYSFVFKHTTSGGFDAINATLYVDGILVKTSTLSTTDGDLTLAGTRSQARIGGAQFNSSYSVVGGIDELILSNTAFSAVENRALYENGLSDIADIKDFDTNSVQGEVLLEPLASNSASGNITYSFSVDGVLQTGATTTLSNIPFNIDSSTGIVTRNSNILDSSYNGYVVRVTATDGTGASTTQNYILSGNERANISGIDTGNLVEDDNTTTSTTGTLLSSDTDNDDNKFNAISIAQQATYGTYTITEDGVWTYNLDDNLAQAINVAGDTDSFIITSIDGSEHTVTITITGSEDASIIGDFSEQTIILNNQPIKIADSITITDVDSKNLLNLTIKIVNYNNGEDSFFLAGQKIELTSSAIALGNSEFNYIASEDASNNLSIVINFGTEKTVAEYQVLLKTLSYNNSNLENPDRTARAIQIIANEGTSNEGTITANLNIGNLTAQEDITDSNTLVTITDAGTYQITSVVDQQGNDASSLFEINVAGEISLQSGSFLDYEAIRSYKISVDITDTNGNTKEQIYILNVTDVDDGDFEFLNSDYINSLDHSNLLGAYNFEEIVTGGSSAKIDDIIHASGDSNELDGAIGTGANSGVTGGISGKYLSLDQSNSANLSLENITLGNAFSLSGWYKFDQDDTDSNEYFFSATTSNGGNFSIYRTADDYSLIFLYRESHSSGPNDYIIANNVIDASAVINEFDHYSFVMENITKDGRDAIEVFIYVNGSLAITNTIFSSGGNLTLAGDYSNVRLGRNLDGGIDDVILSNTALSGVEVRVLAETALNIEDISFRTVAETVLIEPPLASNPDSGTITYSMQVDYIADSGELTTLTDNNIPFSIDTNTGGVTRNSNNLNINYDNYILRVIATDSANNEIIQNYKIGIDQEAIIIGATTANIALISDVIATGELQSTDSDSENNKFTASSGNSTYGTYSITEDGVWSYNLDKTNSLVSNLSLTNYLTDSFIITSIDGTQKTINLNIGGVAENILDSSTIFTVTFSGTYNISSVTDHHGNIVTGLFEINSSGEVSLVTGQNLDYETTNSYDFEITITNGANSTNKNYSFNVVDIKDGDFAFINIDYISDLDVSNIIGAYNFQDSVTGGAGAIIDDVAHSDVNNAELDGTIGTNVNSGANSGETAIGKYLSLDGSDQSNLSLGNVTLGNEFTLSGWFKFDVDDLLSGGEGFFFANTSSGGNFSIYRPANNDTRIITLYHETSTLRAYILDNNIIDISPDVNEFNHYSFTFKDIVQDGNNAIETSLYINGILNRTYTLSSSAGDLTLAGDYTNVTIGNSIEGGIDDVILSNTVLSGLEVRMLYEGAVNIDDISVRITSGTIIINSPIASNPNSGVITYSLQVDSVSDSGEITALTGNDIPFVIDINTGDITKNSNNLNVNYDIYILRVTATDSVNNEIVQNYRVNFDQEAVITGATTSNVALISNVITTGILQSTDVDSENNKFTASSGNSTYGTYSITEDGVWSYSLDKTNSSISNLSSSDYLNDSFIINSIDGTEKTINLNIGGVAENIANNIVIFTIADSGTYNINSVVDHKGNTVTGLFEININGEVSLVAGKNLDYEMTDSYTLNISVTNGGNTINQNHNINVIDTNDGDFEFINIDYLSDLDTSNIIGAYIFETAGTTIDDVVHSSNELDGTISTGANSGVAEGIRGKHLSLDGSSTANLSLGDVTLENEFSLSGWFKFDQDNISSNEYFFSANTANGGSFTAYRQHSSDTNILILYRESHSSGPNDYLIINDVIDISSADSEFNHYSFTFEQVIIGGSNAIKISVYVNSTLSGEKTVFSSGGDLTLAGDYSNFVIGRGLEGGVDDVILSDISLSVLDNRVLYESAINASDTISVRTEAGTSIIEPPLASNPDSGVITYNLQVDYLLDTGSVTTLTGNNNPFIIDTDTGEITRNSNNLNINYDIYILRVTATDGANNKIVQNYRVNLNKEAIITGKDSANIALIGDVITATGILSSSDIDNENNKFTAVNNVSSDYGTYSITSDGVWTYSLDKTNSTVSNVALSDYLTDNLIVTSIDGTSKTISINIGGVEESISDSTTLLTVSDSGTYNIDSVADDENNNISGLFEINTNGEIKLASGKFLDYEDSTQYTISVEITNGGSSTVSDYILNVFDIDDTLDFVEANYLENNSDNLIASYDFDNGTGEDGVRGNYFQSNASNNISLGNTKIGNEFTFSGWFQFNQDDPSEGEFLFSSESGYLGYLSSQKIYQFLGLSISRDFYNGHDDIVVTFNESLNVGDFVRFGNVIDLSSEINPFQHYSFVFEEATSGGNKVIDVSLYIDGILESTKTLSSSNGDLTLEGTRNTLIGDASSFQNHSSVFNVIGGIDEVVLSDKALSAVENRALYENGLSNAYEIINITSSTASGTEIVQTTISNPTNTSIMYSLEIESISSTGEATAISSNLPFSIDSSTGTVTRTNNSLGSVDGYILKVTISDAVNNTSIQNYIVDVVSGNTAPEIVGLDNSELDISESSSSVFPNVIINDQDAGDEVTSATITITGYDAGNDEYYFVSGQNITENASAGTATGISGVSYQESNSNANELTITLAANNQENLQNALQNFSSKIGASDTNVNNISLTLNDGTSDSNIESRNIVAPIVLDLDGDGIEYSNIAENNVLFDVDDDGNLERTAWVGADDGLLVYDYDQDNQINKADEISFVGYRQGAKTDLEGLLAFDSNNDQKLDKYDEHWLQFKVWQDVNQDGVSDEGEIFTLDELGITEISLESDNNYQEIGDVVEYGQASYKIADGKQHKLGDAGFVFENEENIIDNILEKYRDSSDEDTEKTNDKNKEKNRNNKEESQNTPSGYRDDSLMEDIDMISQTIAIDNG